MEEEEQVDQTMVTFGSIIAISDFVDQDTFIFSDGFLKTTTILKNFVYKDGKRKSYEGLENNSFYKCLFQVLPRYSDTVKTKVLKQINETEQQRQSKETEEEKQSVTFKRMNEELSSLMNEYKQNIDTMDKSKCQKLTYHQPFQLLHVASGRFLACHDNESFYENQNYQVKLDDYSSDFTVFKIVPAYMYQSHGEQDVNAGEMCAITRAVPISNRQAYLNISALELSEIKGNSTQKSEHIIKREVNASVEHSHSWKIVLYQQYISEASRNLRVGDCIWLYHSEAEAALSVLKYKEAVDKQNFAFFHLSEWLSIKNLYVAITKSQSEGTQGYQGSTNGLWQIEGAELLQGGFVKYEQGYRLKNISTGYYLSVYELENANKTQKRQKFGYRLTQEQDKTTIFTFVDLKTQPNQKYLKGGSYTYLQNWQTKNWMDFQLDKQTNSYIPILKPENEKTEHAVFKIHMATRNEVWEIQFLLSCFRLLAKFLIQIQDHKFPGVENFQSRRKWFSIFASIQNCVRELEDFVNNKAYTTSADQIFGMRDQYKQKLMREQFYIDIMVKILDRLITKGELEFFQKQNNKPIEKEFKQISFYQSNLMQLEEQEIFDEQEGNLKIQIFNYIKAKVELADQIYQFLGCVCKLNRENQFYTYDLVPYFQFHTKYLPSAIEAIINIVASNKNILFKLSDDIKIEFNVEEQLPLVQNEQTKILINLYQGDYEEEQIAVRQHEKIILKPVPLIQYFVNLLWDDDAKNNSYYLKFLRNVCSFMEYPIQINQGNIYKLYKLNNTRVPKLGVETKAEESKSNDGTVRLTSKAGQLIIPNNCDMDDPDQGSKDRFMSIIEQLSFFSEVATGRNFFWKKELGAQFEKSFLFRNIWNERPIDLRYRTLQPGFAKLALNLYIDQEPLRTSKVPVMCQLFKECDEPKNFRLFKSSTNEGTSNIQELNTYKDLINNLWDYLKRKGERIKEIMCPAENQQAGQQQDLNYVGEDILKDELILNTTRILDKIMKLNLITVLDYSLDETQLPNHLRPLIFIQQMLKSCMEIFVYEKFQMNLIKAHCQTERERVKKKLEEKSNQNKISAPNFMNLLKKTQKEDDEEEQRGESQINNEQNTYLNPVMRGFLKLSAKIQTFNFLDPKYIENEVQLKIKICDFIEYLLDMRQDFMMQNTLVFFKKYFLHAEHIENNPQAYSLYLKKNNKKKKSGQKKEYHQYSRDELNLLIIQRLVKFHSGGLLPNLAQTGIKEIDSPQKEKVSLTSFTKNLIKINQEEEKPKTRFCNYINDSRIPEILDLDQYLSLALGDTNPNDQPVATLLPTFLHTFSHVQDKELEKRCLQLMLRLFTQKEEFKRNLQQLQVIFDEEKTILYKFITQNLEPFERLIERLDSWITNFIYQDTQNQDLEKVYNLLKSFYHGMRRNLRQQDNELISDNPEIDEEKQQLFANLNAHQVVVNLLADGLRYAHEFILDYELETNKKVYLIDFFKLTFDVLISFCQNEKNNQILLYEHINCFGYLQYDLGQLELLENIFRNNKALLFQKVDQQLINTIMNLILKEGRQLRFLKILHTLMIYEKSYIFDNQILIQNSLIPPDLGESNIKILYCDGARSFELKMCFDDQMQDPYLQFSAKLEEIDFRDTFRDEPFYYHRELLDVLIQTTLMNVERRAFHPDIREDQVKNNFNISVSKLKRLFTAEYLLSILKQKDNFLQQPLISKGTIIQSNENQEKIKGITIMKLQVAEFLRLVHISSERGQIQHSQLYTCQTQVIEVIDFEFKRLDKITELSQYPEELQEYHFKGIFPFCLAYHERFLKNLEKQELRKDLNIMERFIFQWLCKMKNMTSEQNILFPIIQNQNQAKLIKRCLETFCPNFYKKFEQQNDDMWIQVSIKLNSLVESDPPQQETIFQTIHPVKKSKSKQMNSLNKDEEDLNILDSEKKGKKDKARIYNTHNEEDQLLDEFKSMKPDQIQALWKVFLKELLSKDQFQKEVEKERETIASAILNVQGLLNPQHSKTLVNKPDVKSISRKLISYLQSAFTDPKCQGTIQTLLQVLQKIIDADPKRKEEMQRLFDKLGATQMVLLVLSESNQDKKLMMSFLRFINTLLDGGNEQVQGTIYSFMINFNQSEKIFQKIYFIIRKQIENLEILSKSKGGSEEGQLGLFQLDEIEIREDLSLVQEVLTFLQNAVEGHYRKLQNYFREQTNSKNNYDLTNAITDLFKTYYYDGCVQKNYNNILKCLDTLNELVQGPCPDNQKAISESKFLDIAADLFQQQHIFDVLDKPESYQSSRKSQEPLKRWQTCRLMNKILNLIISLLEGSEINSQNPILKRIMRNLPMSLLEKHAVNEYNKFVRIYGNKYEIEALEHMAIDPRKLRRKNDSKFESIKKLADNHPYFETILQNGFLLFFLMSYYMDCDPFIVSPITKICRMHKKKILKLQTSNEVWQFFKDSVVYMAIQFTLQLVRNLLGTLNSMKDLATDQFLNNAVDVMLNEDDLQKLKEQKYREDLTKAVNFYLQNSAHIDIMHDNNLEVVYFIKLPLANYLPKEQKVQFHDIVERSTTQSKVQGLINVIPTLIEVCKHEEYLKRLFDRQKYLALLTEHVRLWRELAFLLTLFLNLFILFSFDGTVGDRVQDYIFFSQYEKFTSTMTKTIIYIVGIVMTCLSLFVVSFYLLKNAPLILKRAWLQKGLFEGQDSNPVFALIDLFYKAFQTILSFLQEVEVMYYIAYGLFAILGTFYHPLFFIFHLTEILFRYPTLKNIILSVYRPRIQLILTFFLLFLLVYIFTLLAYWQLSNQFSGYCDTLLYCFLMNIEWTFRGSIGGYLQEIEDVKNVGRELSVGRFFYDELSNIILGVIMLNIVAGIIIDTFGSLREEESNKLSDMVEVCFICGNLKADFDRLQSKSNGGFREHIKVNHYMWNYMYFYAYLDWKEKTEYSGTESYVAQKLKEEDLCWIPFNKARELVDIEGNQKVKERELIQKIEERVSFVQEQIIDMGKLLKVDMKSKR